MDEGIRSAIELPIFAQQQLIGSFSLGSEHPAAFDQRLVELARELADRFAMTLQGARLYEQVRSGKERLALLSRQLIRTQEDERRRISRELHDEVGQALTASKVNLQALQQSAADLASVILETTATVDHTMQQVNAFRWICGLRSWTTWGSRRRCAANWIGRRSAPESRSNLTSSRSSIASRRKSKPRVFESPRKR